MGHTMNDITVTMDDDGDMIITVIVNGVTVWVETVPPAELPDAYRTLNMLWFHVDGPIIPT